LDDDYCVVVGRIPKMLRGQSPEEFSAHPACGALVRDYMHNTRRNGQARTAYDRNTIQFIAQKYETARFSVALRRGGCVCTVLTGRV
jgi:hypothetical protein